MSKRNDGVRYLHFRVFEETTVVEEDGSEYETDVPAARGGATVAYVPEGHGFRYSVAYCSENDNFNRRIGRAVSKGRLAHEAQSQMSEQHDNKSFTKAMDDFFEEAWGYYRR